MQCEEAVHLATLLCADRLWLLGSCNDVLAPHQVSLMQCCASCILHYSTHRWWAHLQTLSDAGLWRLHRCTTLCLQVLAPPPGHHTRRTTEFTHTTRRLQVLGPLQAIIDGDRKWQDHADRGHAHPGSPSRQKSISSSAAAIRHSPLTLAELSPSETVYRSGDTALMLMEHADAGELLSHQCSQGQSLGPLPQGLGAGQQRRGRLGCQCLRPICPSAVLRRSHSCECVLQCRSAC